MGAVQDEENSHDVLFDHRGARKKILVDHLFGIHYTNSLLDRLSLFPLGWLHVSLIILSQSTNL